MHCRISYEDWLACNHFQEIESAQTKWLYEMEMRFARLSETGNLERDCPAENRRIHNCTAQIHFMMMQLQEKENE